jgi:hypothetical protein
MGTGSSCDYNFEIGESYVVFARGPEKRLTTHSCAGNRPLKMADEILKVLGTVEKPREATQDPDTKPVS